MKARDYVIIGQQPDGEVVVVRHTAPEWSYQNLASEIVRQTFARFKYLYPHAQPVKATNKSCSGGVGWSESYELKKTRTGDEL